MHLSRRLFLPTLLAEVIEMGLQEAMAIPTHSDGVCLRSLVSHLFPKEKKLYFYFPPTAIIRCILLLLLLP